MRRTHAIVGNSKRNSSILNELRRKRATGVEPARFSLGMNFGSQLNYCNLLPR
jgi:hypothetical protein